MSGASEKGNGRASGPVLQSEFLVVLAHSAAVTLSGAHAIGSGSSGAHTIVADLSGTYYIGAGTFGYHAYQR